MIQAEALSMRYGRTVALREATFEARAGEVLGLLGPNGAGKSTTLKILATFIHPTSGRFLIDGIDAWDDPLGVRRRIGYLPETVPLYPDMLACEYLDFVGRARGLAGSRLATRMDQVAADCGLEPVWWRPIGQLSKGFRQRVGLAQALIHDPDILILDEPTSGLDPLQVLEIRRLVKELGRTKTVLFSTHVLQEIQAVSDRVMIISEGRIIAAGAPAELQERAMGSDRLLVEVDVPAAAAAVEVEPVLAALPGVLAIEPGPASTPGAAAFRLRHAFGDQELTAHVVRACQQQGWRLCQAARDRYSLEDVFIALTREAAGTARGATAVPAVTTAPGATVAGATAAGATAEATDRDEVAS